MREAIWALALLVLLAGAALTAGWTAFIDAPTHATGLVHPEFESLQIGGSGEERHGPVLVAGWLLGVLVLAVIVALMAFAYRGDGRLRVIGPLLGAAFVLEVVIFTAIVVSYAHGLDEPATATVFGFPRATAWLLYALWPSKLIFVGIFVVTFERAYWRPQDEARFRALLDKERG